MFEMISTKNFITMNAEMFHAWERVLRLCIDTASDSFVAEAYANALHTLKARKAYRLYTVEAKVFNKFIDLVEEAINMDTLHSIYEEEVLHLFSGNKEQLKIEAYFEKLFKVQPIKL